MDLNVSKNDHKVMAPKEVRSSLVMGVENIQYPSKKSLVVGKKQHLLMLNVNGMLCETTHLRSSEKWNSIIPPMWYGNKLVSP